MMNDRSSILNVDKEHQQITLIVNTLYHNILRPYTAHANEREVIEGLFDFFKKSEITIISKHQLKVYQELEKTIIDASMFKANSPLKE